jgi:hypothetical protein
MLENIGEQEDFFSGLQHLKFKGHEVILFHTTDQSKEMDFDFQNRPYRFIDIESGEKIDIFPDQVKDEYKKRIKDYSNQIKVKCNQYHIDYVETDINKGFYTVLQNYLVKRTKLY